MSDEELSPFGLNTKEGRYQVKEPLILVCWKTPMW